MDTFADAFPSDNVRHHFVGQDADKGVYAKELHIPAGYELISHAHAYDHLSILASGRVVWTAGAATRWLCGPCVISVKAGAHHSLRALSDAVWFCIHPTAETAPDRVDEVILKHVTIPETEENHGRSTP